MRIALPTTQGWLVEWETGEIRLSIRTKTPIAEKDCFETTDYSKALEKKAELEKAGFQNVQIYEAFF